MRRSAVALLVAAALVVAARPASAQLVITPTFTSNFIADFGANATAAENAWKAAASVFENNFSDPIHINIIVDATGSTSPFGQSNTFLLSTTYSNLVAHVDADAKTADDLTATGLGGSVTATDPTGGQGTWWVTTSQAKALGLIADNSSNDGTTTFGAANPFTFSGPIAPGTYDFQGVAAHEISEVMGRLGIMGGTIGGFANSFSLADLFTYTGPGARGGGFTGSCSSAHDFFSIDNGTALLKQENDYCSNGLDVDDWASGTNDSFNQFSGSGVVNPMTGVDLRQIDVLGYDRVTSTPEPSTLALMITGLAGVGASGFKRRQKRRSWLHRFAG